MTARPRAAFTEGKGLVLLLGALTALDPLTIDMYLPAFGDIRRSFGTSIAHVELSVTTFFIGMALGQLVYGPLADRFGRRRPLVAGMLVYLMSTIGCAVAPGIGSFIGLRLLEALGGSAGMVITRAIVRDLFDKRRVAEFLSHMALVMGLAPILAPTLGALVDGAVGWRGIFGFLVVANVSCLTAILVLLPETNTRRTARLEPRAVLRGYASLLRTRGFIGYLIPDAAMRSGMFAYIAGSPFVFIRLFHIPERHYGWIFGMNGLGLMLAAQVNRRLLRTWTPETILRTSTLVAVLAAAAVFVTARLEVPPAVVLAALFAFLATLNFITPNALASALAPQGHQAGTASALYGCTQWTMATLSSSLVSLLHDGTSLPMTGVIFGCGLLSFSAYRLLARPGR